MPGGHENAGDAVEGTEDEGDVSTEGADNGGEASQDGNVKKEGFCSLVLVKETMARKY